MVPPSQKMLHVTYYRFEEGAMDTESSPKWTKQEISIKHTSKEWFILD